MQPHLNNHRTAFRFKYKVTLLRECPTPENLQLCDTPAKAADYWRLHIPAHPYFNPECECCVVLMLNTRRRVKGHYLVASGTNETLLIHPREVFRLAIMTSAAGIVLMHNHPSGEPAPSEADSLGLVLGFETGECFGGVVKSVINALATKE